MIVMKRITCRCCSRRRMCRLVEDDQDPCVDRSYWLCDDCYYGEPERDD